MIMDDFDLTHEGKKTKTWMESLVKVLVMSSGGSNRRMKRGHQILVGKAL